MRIIHLFLLIVFTCLLIPVISQAGPPDLMLRKMGTISGQIYVNDTPQAFALVSFFLKEKGPPPIEGGMRRVPEFLSRTDAEGKFKVNVSAGVYYVGVLIRVPGAVPGPPRQGEKFYFVSEKAGELSLLNIKAQEVVDKGRLNVALSETFRSLEDFFTVEGVVRDNNGAPVKGVVVLGKSQLNIPRPEFISKRTDESGSYQLKLPPQKAFYLIARETIAGARPRPGSFIGTYGIESKTGLATPSIFGAGSPPPGVVNEETGNKALSVSGGLGEKVSNADISMYMVPNPEEIRTSIQGTVNAPKFEQGVALNNISFAYNSHSLRQKSFAELDLWVSFLKGQQEMKVVLRGYTDSAGDHEYNIKLSKNRAQAVADYLVGKGVNSNRLIVKGVGSAQPVATNDTPEGRSLNRRVEIKFVE
ncbi:MAG: OmpA family protein [Desulfobulbaceae bacterium]|nr:OmpA family protein [Desulfobulbaceae bacterium]